MTTPRELLDVISDFVRARAEGADDPTVRDIVQRFDVMFTDALAERASVAPEA